MALALEDQGCEPLGGLLVNLAGDCAYIGEVRTGIFSCVVGLGRPFDEWSVHG